jgi:hypothetical protein
MKGSDLITTVRKLRKVQKRKSLTLPQKLHGKKVAIVGSRDYPNLDSVAITIQEICFMASEFVSGGAVGVNTTAEKVAGTLGIPIVVYEPDWDQYGKGAGYVRNKDIVRAAEVVVAFHYNDSKGTRNSIELAKQYGKLLVVFKWAKPFAVPVVFEPKKGSDECNGRQ